MSQNLHSMNMIWRAMPKVRREMMWEVVQFVRLSRPCDGCWTNIARATLNTNTARTREIQKSRKIKKREGEREKDGNAM